MSLVASCNLRQRKEMTDDMFFWCCLLALGYAEAVALHCTRTEAVGPHLGHQEAVTPEEQTLGLSLPVLHTLKPFAKAERAVSIAELV